MFNREIYQIYKRPVLVVFSKYGYLPALTSFSVASGGLQSEVLFADIEFWKSTKTSAAAAAGIALGNCSLARYVNAHSCYSGLDTFIGLPFKVTFLTNRVTF